MVLIDRFSFSVLKWAGTSKIIPHRVFFIIIFGRFTITVERENLFPRPVSAQAPNAPPVAVRTSRTRTAATTLTTAPSIQTFASTSPPQWRRTNRRSWSTGEGGAHVSINAV